VSELVATRIREHAERLRLTHLAEGLDGLVDRAEQQTMGYLDFLDLVLEEEVGVREGRRFRNALKLSGLPHHKGVDGFDFAFQPDLDARKVRDLATLGFVQAKANVCFLGPPGVGKTMLAVAWPSLPARPATRSTSPPWTTWFATSKRPRPPAASPRNSRPT
jgi:DNA replication protein DnaC